MEKIFRCLLRILEMTMGRLNELHNLPQNLPAKIKFTIESNSKELPF